MDLLTVQIENKTISFYVKDVERVLNAVEITELPGHPEIMLGAINFHGEILPVADIRRKFSLQAKPVDPDDKMVILKTGERRFVVLVDRVLGSLEVPDEMIKDLNASWPELKYDDKVLDTAGELVIINNTKDFFLNVDVYHLDEILRKISDRS
ncbi:MAG: chemotaxis protein CheW [Acidobacteriota bacterium]